MFECQAAGVGLRDVSRFLKFSFLLREESSKFGREGREEDGMEGNVDFVDIRED